MDAGADFIKTSTGKSMFLPLLKRHMLCAGQFQISIRNRYHGWIQGSWRISSVPDALLYYHIVDQCLGSEWHNNKYFRIGASRLANNILSEIAGERHDISEQEQDIVRQDSIKQNWHFCFKASTADRHHTDPDSVPQREGRYGKSLKAWIIDTISYLKEVIYQISLLRFGQYHYKISRNQINAFLLNSSKGTGKENLNQTLHC